MRDVDNRDMHKMLWMESPAAPFGGSKFDHRMRQRMQEAEALGVKVNRWAHNKTEKKESE